MTATKKSRGNTDCSKNFGLMERTVSFIAWQWDKINVKKDIVEPCIFLHFCPLPVTPMIKGKDRYLTKPQCFTSPTTRIQSCNWHTNHISRICLAELNSKVWKISGHWKFAENTFYKRTIKPVFLLQTKETFTYNTVVLIDHTCVYIQTVGVSWFSKSSILLHFQF